MADLLQNQVLGLVLRDRFAAGEEKGRPEGERKLLLKLLTTRFGPLSDSIRTHIASASEDQLSDWGVRMLSANRPEDLVGETNG